MTERIPDDRNYTERHTWVKLDEAPVRMGVTRELVDRLDTLLSIELPAPDVEMMEDVAFGEIEAMDRIFQLYPPARAQVLESNSTVAWDLDKLQEDPYGEGWLLKIKVHDSEELKDLLTPEAYREYCEKDDEESAEESSNDE